MWRILRRSARSVRRLQYHVCSYCSSTNPRKENLYDVTIVGGGMVGASLACALGFEGALSKHRVLVVEAGHDRPFELPEKYSNRVSSITPGSRKLLESVGAWDHISNMRVKHYKRLNVWDACGDGHIVFDSSPDLNSDSDMACIVENNVIVAALNKQMKLLEPTVTVKYGARIKKINFPDPAWAMESETRGNPWMEVELEDGSVIQSRLLVGADGAASTVRKATDIEYLSWSYEQWGVVGTLRLGEITENVVAWQKFLPTGPLALLPLSETHSSVVWTTTREHAQELVSLPEDRFVDAINNAFWEDMDRHPAVDTASKLAQSISSFIEPFAGSSSAVQMPPSISGVEEGSRGMFPLGLGHATHYVQPRLALIGDAAHRVHPLAGQGVNLGFGDVACLRDVLVAAAKDGCDLGSLDHLLQYETERQRSVVPMMAAVDFLKRLFSTSHALPVAARTLGLLTTNALTPVKEQIISFAMK
ncbi:ubiquinone biosynthesis monooxygenase COQ6, mitochondrial [Nematostella vectensis]|uniref:ubiquinone biosynthesis monooxygenase COQ6, mitochondrial n=1 Tax=Nematostella vectensis TaxID=45351 RepID=UPI0020773DCE|nr:ubiquinone biosynthesis monooxygenase COQ6, mitochondrial [Nematostella vectensis]